ncbi:MAG: ArnT family glycosyltransferase [Promethearchaeota archaeon]
MKITEKLTFVLIIFFGALLRFYFTVSHPVNSDAAWHLAIAENIAKLGHIPQADTFRHYPFLWHPPLFHLIAAQLYETTSNALIMQFLSPIFGVMTLFITFAFIRSLFRTDIALLTTFFLAIIPLHLYFSVISYVATAITFLTIFCVFLYLKGISDENQKMVILSGLSFGLSILTKATGFAIAFILLIIFCLYYRKKKVKVFNLVLTIVIGFLVGTLWYLRPYLAYGNPFGPAAFLFGSASRRNILEIIITERSYLIFFNQPERLLAYFWVLSRNSSIISFITPIIMSLTFLYGLFELLRRRQNSDIVLMAIVFVFTAIVIVYLLDHMEVQGVRLCLPMLPTLSGIVAFGVLKLFFSEKTHILYSWRLYLLTFLFSLICASSTYSIYEKTFTVSSDIEIIGNACIWIDRYTLDSTKLLNDGWRDDVEYLSKRYTVFSGTEANFSRILNTAQTQNVTYLLLQESFGLKEGTIEIIDTSTKFNKVYESDFSIHIYCMK